MRDRSRYQQETVRVAALLREEIRRQGVSIRSLEQKMGVGNSIFQKVLTGRIKMTLEHLLAMADALGLDWPTFFRLAYAGPAEESKAPRGEDELEEKVLAVLYRYGLLPRKDV
ncbi:MAG TPA: helix-turn-helix transcriptional regulator [Thermoanaerobaculia bacterium]|nr:helix-turn-helix transcriptional regulator [Thermoanaerobaculia bacterium]